LTILKGTPLPGGSDVKAQLRQLAASAVDDVRAWAEQICLVPAPSYQEAARAQFVAGAFQGIGWSPDVDNMGNVVLRRRGNGRAKSLMLAAHTDTVFPSGTEISVRHDDGRLIGPGIGDNSLGVASLLGLIKMLDQAGIETPGDLLFVANVGEEGLGNLRGIRAMVDRFQAELGAVIAVEGHNLGRVTHAGVGSKRIRVTVAGPGGHSWGAFGQPSAIHELGNIVSEISRLDVPADPKTTFNVGMIEGGVSVNTIAPLASAVIDMRSVDPVALDRLAERVEGIISSAQTEEIRTTIEVLGERPAGRTDPSSRIVRVASDILLELGFEPELNASSTDANIPISRGIPAICIGLTQGSGAHRVDESIEIAPIEKGLLQLGLLAAAFPVG
jgi:acetylornithine deacetylase/succinyl-diaminopimelate desuccinylase-like protein